VVDLRRSEEALVAHDMVAVVEPDATERMLAEFSDAVRLAGGDHEIVWLVVLKHQPHRLDIVAGETPVASCVEVAEMNVVGRGRATMSATALEILRVTKFSPRRGLS
jgi:hypothetical protein